MVVIGETLGEGNGSNKIFYTDNYPLVDTTGDETVTTADIVVKVAGTPVTVTTVDAITGKITLEAAPGAGQTVNGDYSYSDVSEITIGEAVLFGENEAEGLTGLVFTDSNSKIDYFDGDSLRKTYQLRKYPVQSITAVEIREPGKTSWETQTLADGDGIDDDYWKYITDGDSYLEFVVAPYIGNQNVKISYTHGYSTVPKEAEELSASLASIYIHTLVDAGWSISSYRLVEQEVSFGEGTPHGTAIKLLIERIDRCLSYFGRVKRIGIIR